MTSVSHVTAMYATKRRRRNSKNVRTVCSKDSHSKSNPSKRHRERLNQELDTLASLLPFEQSVLSKLDKLSILRLSVSYLRTKSYFQAALSSCRLPSLTGQQQQSRAPRSTGYHQQFAGNVGPQQQQQQQQLEPPTQIQQHYPAELRMEGDLIVQALNGFLLILTCDGEVFYTSHTVETYLGFHQSDICHQSVYELVHSEDREELMQQLKWNSMIPQTSLMTDTTNPAGSSSSASNPLATDSERNSLGVALTEQQANKSASQMSLQEILASADHRHLLERNFTVRFRCLLDNTSGFLRLDIRGRIKVLHGQRNQHNLANSAASNKKQQQQAAMFEQGSYEQREPLLAFFGVCIPFGPPSLLEMPSKDSVFKSKHRLDLSIISMDSRGKQLLGLNDLTSIFKQATGTTSPNSDCGSPVPGSGTGGKLQVKLEAGSSAKAASGSASSSSQASATKQQSISAYDLVHQDDLSYMASAHQELLKTGASGLIAYRMITQAEGKHQWLQTSAKLYYKNSKPDFILCTHRPLMEEEGRDLLGKRTMDFKVTYLDVGLSSINDRILACDKFSSLQALGNASNKQIKSPSLTTSNGGSNKRRQHLASSPALSGESSRSLASSSPQSMLNETSSIGDDQSGRQAKATKRKFNYDLDPATNSHLHQQQYASAADYEAGQQNPTQQATAFGDNNNYNTHYKRGHNGDIFYDMDTVQAVNANSDDLLNCVGSRKTTTVKKKASGKVSGKQASKKRAELVQNGQTGNQVMSKSGKSAPQDQQSAIDSQQHQQQVDHQQLHLYNSHYNPHHLQSAEVTADSYPAIQAAAVYAASLGHPHSAASVQHQAYGASVNHHHHHHHGYHNQTASQSAALYGSGSIVSPSAAAAAAYSQHQHHHQHHSHLAHHLDSAGYQVHYSTPTAFANNQTGAVGQSVAANYANAAGSGAAAAAAAAAASSFLPAEHLLHHYSQSAARSAALAVWPSTPAGSASQSAIMSASSNQTDHYHQQQQQHQQHHHQSSHQAAYGGSSGNWGGSAAAAAAAALVASANSSASAESTPNSKRDLNSYSPAAGTIHQDQHYTSSSQTRLSATEQQQYHQQRHQLHHQQQHHHQQQQQQQNSSPTMESSSPSNKSSSSSSLSAAAAVVAQRYTNLAGQPLQNQLLQKSNAPASLSSDGCAHRSPLSSGESSNGSASLAAAQAVAAASAMAANSQEPSASMISPSAYYLSPEQSQQQQQQQQHQQNQHQQQHLTSHHQQQSYAVHQSQQLAAYHHQNPYAAVAQQYGDSSAAHFNQHHYQHHHNQHHHHHHQQAVFEHQQAAAYFQHTSGDLSAAASSAAAAHTVSASAVKLYGANGDMTVPYNAADQYPPGYDYGSLGLASEAAPVHEGKNKPPVQWAAQQAGCKYLTQSTDGYNPERRLGPREDQTIDQAQEDQDDNNDERCQYKSAANGSPTANELVSSWPETVNNRSDGELGQFPVLSSSSSSDASSSPSKEDDRDQESGQSEAEKQIKADGEDEGDQRDPLARLISSTIGDNILDVAPKI